MNILTVAEGELADQLAILTEEQAIIPQAMRLQLLTRRTVELKEKQDWSALMYTIDPVGQGEWDSFKPQAKAMDCDQMTKLSTFASVAFIDVLLPILEKGGAFAREVLQLCDVCLEYYDDLDYAECDLSVASTMTEALSIWKAIKGVGQVELDCNLQDLSIVIMQEICVFTL
eukprot:6455852-Amphidinium_carterae.2